MIKVLMGIIKLIPLLEQVFSGNLVKDIDALITQLKCVTSDCEALKASGAANANQTTQTEAASSNNANS